VIAIGVRLIIITLLVYGLVHFWYGRVEQRVEERIPTTTAVTPPQATEPQAEAPAPVAEDYTIIVTRNIFKASTESKEQGEGQATQEDLAQLNETRLQLALLGTVTGTKDEARAIIRDEQSKAEDLYRIGSQVQGAEITRISRGKVVLQINGREEVLTIKDPEGDGGRQERSARTARPSPTATAPPEGPPPEGSVERPVPQTMPRRRISFRNATPAPPPVAVEEKNIGEDAQNAPSEAPAEQQLLPDDEAAPKPATETDSGSEQPSN
jgi:type II secretory pathway component PulC